MDHHSCRGCALRSSLPITWASAALARQLWAPNWALVLLTAGFAFSWRLQACYYQFASKHAITLSFVHLYSAHILALTWNVRVSWVTSVQYKTSLIWLFVHVILIKAAIFFKCWPKTDEFKMESDRYCVVSLTSLNKIYVQYKNSVCWKRELIAFSWWLETTLKKWLLLYFWLMSAEINSCYLQLLKLLC